MRRNKRRAERRLVEVNVSFTLQASREQGVKPSMDEDEDMSR